MWVKICGIRDADALQAAIDTGADAVGFNFYPKTPRYVAPKQAAELRTLLPETISPVGLFVNESPEFIAETCQQCQISHVQLHGDETPEMIAQLHQQDSSLKLIRAFRVGPDGLDAMAAELEKIQELRVEFFACLVDARVENVYGGSGETAPWELLAGGYRFSEWPQLVLAGGLTPENVAEAVRQVGPWGVDVSSGVESSPGIKDATRVRQFVERARETS
ncbi:MAG: phosphoribosylanthranilate isomerase [Planctomycetaceae bacterium]